MHEKKVFCLTLGAYLIYMEYGKQKNVKSFVCVYYWVKSVQIFVLQKNRRETTVLHINKTRLVFHSLHLFSLWLFKKIK